MALGCPAGWDSFFSVCRAAGKGGYAAGARHPSTSHLNLSRFWSPNPPKPLNASLKKCSRQVEK